MLMLKTMMIMNLIISLTLLKMKSPLKSNLMILIQSISLTLMLSMMNKTSWISYMIFILYISGLMIIFLYISSIAFNEISMKKIKYKNLTLYMMILMMLLFMLNYNFNFETMNYENKFIFEENFYLLNMFMMPNNLIFYFILMILFFILITIIWLLKNNKGPIRQKNNEKKYNYIFKSII